MFYIPKDLLSTNYTYYINNDTITIRTRNNCYYNYQTEYCDCRDLFPKLNYVYSNTYSCASSSYSHTINNNYLSDNFIYRTDFPQIIFLVLFAFIILYLIPFKIFTRLFRRWS